MKKSKVHYLFKRIYPYVFILILTVAILYPQIKTGTYIAGFDSWFHMNQFYETAMQFKTGHLSYFMSLFGFGGIGRIVNAIYGPGFNYLGGLILFLVKTWYRFEIIQSALGLVFGGIFFYILAIKNNVTNLTATLFSALYMMSNLVMSWVINQEFNGVEAILMPLIILQGTQMARTKRIHPISLSIVVAVAFQTHMLTTLMGIVTLIPFFIYTWYRSDHKWQLWKYLLMSIGLTALLTSNVWGALLNVMPQRLIPPAPQGLPTSGGAVIWMVPGHYFSVLGFAYTIIMIVMIGYCVISFLFWQHLTNLYKITSLIGLFFCWLSTSYFPWRWVFKIYPAFVYQIQFPKRFLCTGVVLVFLSVGMLVSNKSQVLNKHRNFHRLGLIAVQVILIIFIGLGFIYQRELFATTIQRYYSSRVIDYNPFYKYNPNHRTARQLRNAYHSPHLLSRGVNLVHQDVPDYLPTNNVIRNYTQYRRSAPYSGVQNQIYNNIKYLHVRKIVSGNRITIRWYQANDKYNVILPLAKYKDTKVMLDHHAVHNVKISRIGMVGIHHVSKGHHEISIMYQTPMWLHVLMWVTMISWFSIFINIIYRTYLRIDRIKG